MRTATALVSTVLLVGGMVVGGVVAGSAAAQADDRSVTSPARAGHSLDAPAQQAGASVGARTAQPADRPAGPDTATAGAYTALAPSRILDTRYGNGGPMSPFPGRTTRTLQVLGRGGVPAGGVGAVVLNVTVADTTTSGFLTIYPGGAVPTASNLNFVAGQIVANLVTVPVAADGTVSIFNAGGGSTDVIADVNGYFASGTPTTDGAFAPIAPGRLLDTRPNGRLQPAVPQKLVVRGRGGVAANAGSVVLNVTVTNPTGNGFFIVYPGGATPTVSNLNFVAGQTVPNLVVVPLASDGTVTLYNGSTGTVDVVVDVDGYFIGSAPSQVGMFGALSPTRILDTRNGTGALEHQLLGLHALQVTVLGTGGVPTSGVAAVVLNVTVADTESGGFLTVYPTPKDSAAPPPTASNLNFLTGQIVPNLVIVPVAADGTILIYNGGPGPVDVIADVTGYVRSSTLAVPQPSNSRYFESFTATQTNASIVATASSAGRADGAATTTSGAHVSLLEFGAQTNRAGGDGLGGGSALGVRLPTTNMRITYAQVRTAAKAYLDAYASARPGTASGPATVAIGTSSDGFAGSTYAPTSKGQDWASMIVAPLVQYGAGENPAISVVGADDIEPDFDASIDQVQAWVAAYLGAGSADLVNNGAASACPTALGAIDTTCGAVRIANSSPAAYNTWTQAQYYAIARGMSPGRLSVLPQIYVPEQAEQWQNIDLTGIGAGSAPLSFEGVLTQVGVCGAACSLTPTEAVAAMEQSLQSDPSTTNTPVPVVTDLAVS